MATDGDGGVDHLERENWLKKYVHTVAELIVSIINISVRKFSEKKWTQCYAHDIWTQFFFNIILRWCIAEKSGWLTWRQPNGTLGESLTAKTSNLSCLKKRWQECGYSNSASIRCFVISPKLKKMFGNCLQLIMADKSYGEWFHIAVKRLPFYRSWALVFN